MIFRIFRDDLKSAVKFFFTFVVIIAICVIPSLYAWINIYANQDPYVNTGNLPVAVASNDQGITLDNGGSEIRGKGDKIVSPLPRFAYGHHRPYINTAYPCRGASGAPGTQSCKAGHGASVSQDHQTVQILEKSCHYRPRAEKKQRDPAYDPSGRSRIHTFIGGGDLPGGD